MGLPMGGIGSLFSARLRQTLFLRAWAFRNIRLLSYLSPSVVEFSKARCVIRIPLKRRTRNHLGSMYFGALCAGADSAAAYLVLKTSGGADGLSVIFKDVRAEFLKRAEGDVFFSCEQGREIAELFLRARESGNRESLPLHVVATVPSKLGEEPVARFELTLSAKRR